MIKFILKQFLYGRFYLWIKANLGRVFFFFIIMPILVHSQTNLIDSNSLKQGHWQLFFPFNSDSIVSEEGSFVNDLEELKEVECDYHLPLGSVPGLIRNDIRDFDRTVTGYFKADPQRVEAIRNELQLDGKAVIGVSWKSFESLNHTKKSIHLRDMERIFTGLDVVLVNLQYGDVDEEIREFKEATGIDVLQCASVDNREDLDGLAALIEACDIVVSITNVTVHMAGALAKETWVLLPYVANFWWDLERTDSVWYPSLMLYRQPALDDWDSVYASIRIDLETRLGCS